MDIYLVISGNTGRPATMVSSRVLRMRKRSKERSASIHTEAALVNII